MTDDNGRCPVCTPQGLAILLARYTVEAPNASAPELAFSGDRVTAIGLETSQYTARLLRQGFVYLFYEKGPLGDDYWETYSVSPEGGLHKQLDAASARPKAETATCQRCRNPLARDFLVINEPEQCTKVWVAFSEVKWSDATLERYEDRAVREKRMQPIEPGEWLDAPQAGDHQMPLEEAGDFEAVAEYTVPYGMIAQLPPETVSDESGWFCSIARCSTRYDVAGRRHASVRYDRQTGKSVDYDPLEDLLSLMRAASPNPKASEGESPHHTPMLLALWDAVSIVHELNAHRSEPMAYYSRYADERVFEVEGSRLIDEARLAAEHYGEAQINQRYLSSRDGYYSRKEGYYVTQGQRREDQHAVREHVSLRARNASAAAELSRDYVGLEESYVTGEIGPEEFRSGRDHLHQTHLRTLESDGDAFWRQREQAALARRNELEAQKREAVQDVWPEYEKRLDTTKLSNFRDLFARLKTEVDRLQGERTTDLRAWLSADLFLDTLGDYDEDDRNYGLAYREVIEEALDGLGSEAQGQAVLQALIDNADLSDRSSLLWRAFALNQMDSKAVLQPALTAAEGHKETPISDENGWSEAGWSVYSAAAAGLKGLADIYTTRDEFGRPSRPVYQSSLARRLGIDRLLLAAGNQVFGKWRVGRVGDYVGEKLIQHIFLTSAGVPQADIEQLIRTQARHQPQLRRDVMNRWRGLRAQGVNPNQAFAIAVSEVAEREGTQRMERRWEAVKQGSGRGALAQHRLAAIIALCEGANFAKLIVTAGDDDVTVGMLVASGMSTVGAIAMVAIDPLSGALREGSQAMLRWRVVGGTLSGAASIIMGWTSAERGRSELAEGYSVTASLYYLKGGLGLAAGGGFIVSAVSSSYRLIQSMGKQTFGRRIVILVVERVGVGVASNAVLRAVMVTVGRVLLRAAGWQVTVALLVIEGLVWYFTPNAMEKWLDKTAFGDKRVFDSIDVQQEEFDEMLQEMGFR